MVNAHHLPAVRTAVVAMLEQDSPDKACELMRSILEAIAEGLEHEQGWSAVDAHKFAVSFGDTINAVLRAVRDRHARTLH